MPATEDPESILPVLAWHWHGACSREPTPMNPLLRFVHPIALALASLFLSGRAAADLQVKAEVISSTPTSSSVRFTFSGTFTGLSAPVNLPEFVFIDFSGATALEAALPSPLNLTSFTSNTVGTGTGGAITTVEVRNNEAGYYDRLGFVFNKSFAAGDGFSANSFLELSIPTTSVITTANFDNLNVYWGFPNRGTNLGRGTLAGTVMNPAAVLPELAMSRNGEGRLEIVFSGVLEFSQDLLTPFAPVEGAISPYLVPLDAPSTMFYRASN